MANAEYSGFVLVAEVAGTDLLRFTTTPSATKAQISGSGAPFTCELLDDRPSLSNDGVTRFVACRVPEDQLVVAGLTGLLAVSFPGRTDVPALPIEAVAGSLSNASVFVRQEGELVEQRITVGVTDGVFIEILEGLSEGQIVELPSPNLLGPQ